MAKRKLKRSQPRNWAPRTTKTRDAIVSCRVTQETLEVLEKFARKNRWTRSAEAEHRLAQSVAKSATSTAAVMAVIGEAIDGLVRMRGKPWADKERPPPPWRRDPEATWLGDAYLHEQAVAAALAAFALLKPKGRALSQLEVEAAGGARQGAFGLYALWNDIRMYNGPKNPNRPTQYERRLAVLREDVGKLPGRVKLWGQTGREAVRWRAEFPLNKAERDEFRKLSQKRFKHGLTRAEHAQWLALHDKFPKQKIPDAEAEAYRKEIADRGPLKIGVTK